MKPSRDFLLASMLLLSVGESNKEVDIFEYKKEMGDRAVRQAVSHFARS